MWERTWGSPLIVLWLALSVRLGVFDCKPLVLTSFCNAEVSVWLLSTTMLVPRSSLILDLRRPFRARLHTVLPGARSLGCKIRGRFSQQPPQMHLDPNWAVIAPATGAMLWLYQSSVNYPRG